jgi:hypothetical protein
MEIKITITLFFRIFAFLLILKKSFFAVFFLKRDQDPDLVRIQWGSLAISGPERNKFCPPLRITKQRLKSRLPDTVLHVLVPVSCLVIITFLGLQLETREKQEAEMVKKFLWNPSSVHEQETSISKPAEFYAADPNKPKLWGKFTSSSKSGKFTR